MNMIILSIFASTLAVSAIFAAPQPRDFGLSVKADGKSSYDKDAVTQSRKLEISLSLAGKETAPDVVVKWTIYGHTRKDNALVVIKSGELKASLEGGKSVALTTPEVTIKGVREHSVSTGSGRSRRAKKVPASGEDYYGYSAVVMNGSTLVAETYSKPSLKGK